ncbi:MAG: class I SAM-dependent methyltransferase [Anaerolineales bacterium]|jgi:SAM-dependent methyltransferase
MMADKAGWHSQDEFWELFEPILFDQDRLERARAEVERIVRLVGATQGERVLDLCCGPGRHSLELSRLGYEVVGVDRTASFIQKAKAEAASKQLPIAFLVGDMREFRQPSAFHLVMNLFGSFGYFEDPAEDRRVVENAYASLIPGGKFLIETMGKEIAARDFREKDWSEVDDGFILAERKPLQHWSRMQTRWILLKGDRRIEHTVTVRSYSAEELASLLLQCGFQEIRVFGDLQGSDYDQNASRLVIVGKK